MTAGGPGAALGPLVGGGLVPRATSLDALEEQVERRRREELSAPERAINDAQTREQAYLEALKRYAPEAYKDAGQVKRLRSAFALEANRQAMIAEAREGLASKTPCPLPGRDRLVGHARQITDEQARDVFDRIKDATWRRSVRPTPRSSTATGAHATGAASSTSSGRHGRLCASGAQRSWTSSAGPLGIISREEGRPPGARPAAEEAGTPGVFRIRSKRPS